MQTKSCPKTDNSRYACKGERYHSLAHRTGCKELQTLRPFDAACLQCVVGRRSGVEGKMKNDEGADQVQSVAEAEGHS